MMNPAQCIGVMTKDGFYRNTGGVKGVIVSDPFEVDGSVMIFKADDRSIYEWTLPNLAQMATHPDFTRATLMELGFRIAADDVAMGLLISALIFPETIFCGTDM